MIVAHCATYPPREKALKETMRRLCPQVDKIKVVFNEYGEVPEWVSDFKNLEAIIPDHDTKDIGKFLPESAAEDIIILIDDDILYPENYVQKMILESTKAGLLHVVKDKSGQFVSGGIGGIHGTTYRNVLSCKSLREIAGAIYHKRWRIGAFRTVNKYWDSLDIPMRVDQIGTGTAVVPGSLMPGYEYMKGAQKRADIRLAQWCYEKNIPIVALPRSKSWMISNEQEDSIYASYTAKMPKSLSREIKSFAFKIKGTGKPWIYSE